MIAARTGQEPRPKARPTRTCVGCRRSAEADALIRLTRSPEGELVVDHPRRLGGRGAWVCPSARCVARATRKGALARTLGGEVVVPAAEVVLGQMRERISARAFGLLESAGRARKVVVGVEDTMAAIRGGSASLVVVAEDLSPRSRADLDGVAAAAGVRVVEFGDRDELGRCVARSVVGAMALGDEGFAASVGRELDLLRGLSAEGPEDGTTSRARRGG